MAYSKGRSRLLRERGSEQAFERKRYEDELAAAESAQKGESGKASLWQAIGSGVGAIGGFFVGGPAGAYKGYHAGKEVGRWGQRIASDYDPADYAISTDVGKFGLSQKYDLEDINRQFEEAEESRKWQDITGTGESLLAFLNPPKGIKGKEWWNTGGGGGLSRKYGIGGKAFAADVTKKGLADNPWLTETDEAFWN